MSQAISTSSDTTDTLPTVEEVACSFGDNSQLVGVYTPPAQLENSEVCAIYITAGLLHHVGPTRLHVELARALSTKNVAGFRFDLSGIGDSETSSLGGYFAERSVAEVCSAMDYLQQQYHYKKFVLVGLCSGADDALATAQIDSRVNGVVLLNGYAYQAGKFKLYRLKEFYVPRIFMLQKWVSKFSKLLPGGKKKEAVADAGTNRTEALSAKDKAAIIALDDDYRYIPPKAETGKIIEELSAKGAQLYFVYNGSEHDSYTYQGQLLDMFPQLIGNDRVKEAYLKEADHTFVIKADRDKLIRWLKEWFVSSTFNRTA